MRNYDCKRHIWVTVAMKGMSSNIIERVHCNGMSPLAKTMDRVCDRLSFLAKEEKGNKDCAFGSRLKLCVLTQVLNLFGSRLELI